MTEKIMWKTSWRGIEPVVCVKETEKTIWTKVERTFFNTGKVYYDTDRSLKVSDYHRFFDTFESARDYMLDTSRKRIESFKDRIRKEEEKIDELMAMEKPIVPRR